MSNPNLNNIEINDQFRKALDLLENSSQSVFISGKAGTGKSTLLEYFRDTTLKNVVVLASTGVAAVNVRGETIHSFFRFKPNITADMVRPVRSKKRAALYKAIDVIVIDEISMVRADLLDCIDKFLRLNGRDGDAFFGGAQMVFIGDLYQLPPVVTNEERKAFYGRYSSSYFFGANVFSGLDLAFVELEKIYRQKDKKFIDILNAIRNNTITVDQMEFINGRVCEDIGNRDLSQYVYLTPTNALASQLNGSKLETLSGQSYYYKGDIEGDFTGRYLPTEMELHLKKNAQVMLLNNDEDGRWVNGTIGIIIDIRKDITGADFIVIELSGGKTVELGVYKWELFRFKVDPGSNEIRSETIGYFIQYPIKLAWAITIHKSQGKTFDKVVLDTTGGIFAPGQLYVALSRCRSLDGIILKKPLSFGEVHADSKIVRFMTEFQYGLSEKKIPLNDKIKLIDKALNSGALIEIEYLKNSDVRKKYIIKPIKAGELSYKGKAFFGVEGIIGYSNRSNVFRLDRILSLDIVNDQDEKFIELA